jgi:hypothetical protein
MGSTIWRGYGARAQRAAERSNSAYGINVSVFVFTCACGWVCVPVGDPNGGMVASQP